MADEPTSARSPGSGFYLWPAAWIGEAPSWANVSVEPGEMPPFPDLTELEAVMLDRAIGPVRARVARDGFFALDFSAYAPTAPSSGRPGDFDRDAAIALRRATFINALIACLSTASIERNNLGLSVTPQGPDDLFAIANVENPLLSMSLPQGVPLFLHDARWPRSYNPHSVAIMDSRLMRFPIPLEVVVDACDRTEALLAHPSSKALSLAELYVRAAAGIQRHDYSNGLMLAWGIVESLINDLWERYLDSQRQRPDEAGTPVPFLTSARRKALRGRTVSSTIETLSLLDELPHGVYDDLAQARDARNKWMHELRPVEPKVATTAAELASRLLRQVHGVDLKISLHRSLHL